MEKRILLSMACLCFGAVIFAQIPGDGLVGFWPFNGNAEDESGFGNDGVVTGALLTSDRFGKPNSAYHFMDMNKISTSYPGIPGNADRSISFWAKIDKSESGGHLMHYGTGTSGRAITIGLFPDSTVHLDVNNATVGFKQNVVNDGAWHHYTYIFSTRFGSSLDGFRIYQDGNLQENISGSYHYLSYNINTGNATPFTIGATSNVVEGTFDDIRFYDRVLDSTEILNIQYEDYCLETVYDTTFVTIYDTISCQPENLALNQSYAASIMDSVAKPGHNPRLAFDDNTLSAWHPQAYPTQWIAVHFKEFVDIDSLMFWYGQSPGSSTIQEIYSTIDSVNWSLIETINPYHKIGGGSYSHILSEKIEGSKGIKVRTTSNSSWIQWKEIMVWGRNPEECLINVYETVPVYDTTVVAILDTVFVTIQDTVFTEVMDTTVVMVHDTLIIDAVLTGVEAPDHLNTLKVYPNPAKDHLFINTGDYTKMNGYRLKIFDQLGGNVFDAFVEEPLYELNLSSWSGTGIYFLQLIDSDGSIIDIRKVILQ